MDKKWFRWFAAVPAAMLAALAFLAWPVRVFLFQPFNIPTSSMEPAFILGDYIAVSKSAYGYGPYSFPFAPWSFEGRIGGTLPLRGDIVVFRLPRDPKVDYVKRIIGLPGDRVQLKGGAAYINGEGAGLELVQLPPAYYGDNGGRFFRETLPGGRSFVIKDLDPQASQDNTEEYVVPAGHYFTLGDNRDNSLDSRWDTVGYIPVENIIGRYAFHFWNSEGFPVGDRPQDMQ